MLNHRAFSVLVCSAWLVAALCVAGAASAEELVVRKLGDGGWKSEDSRPHEPTPTNNLVGKLSTHPQFAAKPPSAADDAALARMIQFRGPADGAPADSTLGGAVYLTTPARGNAEQLTGKVTLSVVNVDKPFATGAWHEKFTAAYRWYGDTGVGAPLLKIAVRSTKWGFNEGQSQFKHKPVRTGDAAFDLVLVLELNAPNGAWQLTTLSADEGKWHLFRQHANENLPKTTFSDMRTLKEWAKDETWGPLLFGPTSKVVNVQFGIGSGYEGAGYVDWIETSLLNAGQRIDFAAGAPLVRTTAAPATKPASQPATRP